MTDGLTGDANVFVQAVTEARKRMLIGLTPVDAGSDQTEGTAGQEGKGAAEGGAERWSDRQHKPVHQFTGFLAEQVAGRPRRLYFTYLLDEGVDVDEDAIIHYVKLPADRKDGLQRDAIWVLDGDIIYWSKHAPKPRDPSGGRGFPLDGPPFG